MGRPLPPKKDPLTPEDRALINRAMELERQCAYLSNLINEAQLNLTLRTEIIATVRKDLVSVKEKIKDRSLSPHYRSALCGHGLVKGA